MIEVHYILQARDRAPRARPTDRAQCWRPPDHTHAEDDRRSLQVAGGLLHLTTHLEPLRLEAATDRI